MNKTLIYANPLEKSKDVDGFIPEGHPIVSFVNKRMRLSSALDESLGQKANFLFWCPEIFPADIEISWDFTPLSEHGLCMMFFAAGGKDGYDLFSPLLALRDGQYQQYYDGDINAYHASYYRRKQPDERIFHTCNLRKSKGFYLVAQGGDPIPQAQDCAPSYRITVQKLGPTVDFFVNDLKIYSFLDDGQQYGHLLQGGRIGFRQMCPMVAEYSNLTVYALVPKRKIGLEDER